MSLSSIVQIIFKGDASGAIKAGKQISSQLEGSKRATAAYAVEMQKARADTHAWAAEIARTKGVIADLQRQMSGEIPLKGEFNKVSKSLEAAQARLQKMTVSMMESKASSHALASEVALAKAKTLELGQATDKAKPKASSFSSSLGNMAKGAVSAAAGFALAQIGITSFAQGIELFKKVITESVDKVEEYKKGIVGTTAILVSLSKVPTPTAFLDTMEYTKEAIKEIVMESAKHISTGKMMQEIFRTFALYRVLPNSQQDIAAIGSISDALVVMGKDERSIQMEIRGLMTGTISRYTMLSRIIKSTTPNLKEWVAEHQKQGDLLQAVNEKLKGFKLAQGEILGLASTWQNTLTTIVSIIQRMAFDEIHADWVKGLKEIVGLLRDQQGQLTPYARLIASTVQKAWGEVKVPIEDMLRLLKDNAPQIVSSLGQAIQVVAVAGANALGVIVKLIGYVQDAQIWYAGYQKNLAKQKLQGIFSGGNYVLESSKDAARTKQAGLYTNWGMAERTLKADKEKLNLSLSPGKAAASPLDNLLADLLKKIELQPVSGGTGKKGGGKDLAKEYEEYLRKVKAYVEDAERAKVEAMDEGLQKQLATIELARKKELEAARKTAEELKIPKEQAFQYEQDIYRKYHNEKIAAEADANQKIHDEQLKWFNETRESALREAAVLKEIRDKEFAEKKAANTKYNDEVKAAQREIAMSGMTDAQQKIFLIQEEFQKKRDFWAEELQHLADLGLLEGIIGEQRRAQIQAILDGYTMMEQKQIAAAQSLINWGEITTGIWQGAGQSIQQAIAGAFERGGNAGQIFVDTMKSTLINTLAGIVGNMVTNWLANLAIHQAATAAAMTAEGLQVVALTKLYNELAKAKASAGEGGSSGGGGGGSFLNTVASIAMVFLHDGGLVQKRAGGGFIQKFGGGGFSGRVPGFGSGDKVPALLEPGEFVMSRAMVNQARSGGSAGKTMNVSVSINHYGDIRSNNDLNNLRDLVRQDIIGEMRLVPSF